MLLQAVPTPVHDLYWPTVLQAFATGAVFLVTGALGWVTWKLVEATRELSAVGEKTWQSSVGVLIDLTVADGICDSSGKASIVGTNSCAIVLENVHMRIFSGLGNSYEYRGKVDVYIKDARERRISCGSLGPGVSTVQESYWEDALFALNMPSDGSTASPTDDLFPALTIGLYARHSVTKHDFFQTKSYRVVDIGRGSVRLDPKAATGTRLRSFN